MAQYDACPHAGWLYVASTMMSRYGGMPECVPHAARSCVCAGRSLTLAPRPRFAKYLVGMVIRMTNKTFGMLRGGLPAFTANPDIVEDLFRMVRPTMIVLAPPVTPLTLLVLHVVRVCVWLCVCGRVWRCVCVAMYVWRCV